MKKNTKVTHVTRKNGLGKYAAYIITAVISIIVSVLVIPRDGFSGYLLDYIAFLIGTSCLLFVILCIPVLIVVQFKRANNIGRITLLEIAVIGTVLMAMILLYVDLWEILSDQNHDYIMLIIAFNLIYLIVLSLISYRKAKKEGKKNDGISALIIFQGIFIWLLCFFILFGIYGTTCSILFVVVFSISNLGMVYCIIKHSSKKLVDIKFRLRKSQTQLENKKVSFYVADLLYIFQVIMAFFVTSLLFLSSDINALYTIIILILTFTSLIRTYIEVGRNVYKSRMVVYTVIGCFGTILAMSLIFGTYYVNTYSDYFGVSDFGQSGLFDKMIITIRIAMPFYFSMPEHNMVDIVSIIQIFIGNISDIVILGSLGQYIIEKLLKSNNVSSTK
jgi:hypothetical protein